METLTPAENLQLQSRPPPSRQQYIRGRVVRQPRQDRAIVPVSKRLSSPLVDFSRPQSYPDDSGRNKDDNEQAHRTAFTTQAANPFEDVKPPKANEWGMAPSRGGHESYKEDDQDRLFEGGGRREIPDGLRKKAEEEREQLGKEDDMGGKESDDKDGDSEDDRDDWEKGLVPVEEMEEDDDDGLKGFVNAEDNAAYDEWLKDDGKSNGNSLSKEDLLKRRDERWAKIMKHAEEQNTKEDEEWLEGVTAQAVLIQDIYPEEREEDFEKLAAMLRYQPSRRLAKFRISPAVAILQSLYMGWVSLRQRLYQDNSHYEEGGGHLSRKYCARIFGQGSSLDLAFSDLYDRRYSPADCPWPLIQYGRTMSVPVDPFNVPCSSTGPELNEYIKSLAAKLDQQFGWVPSEG